MIACILHVTKINVIIYKHFSRHILILVRGSGSKELELPFLGTNLMVFHVLVTA